MTLEISKRVWKKRKHTASYVTALSENLRGNLEENLTKATLRCFEYIYNSRLIFRRKKSSLGKKFLSKILRSYDNTGPGLSKYV